MNSKSSPKFAESLALDAPEPSDTVTQTRRIATYSVEALRLAASIEKIHVNHTAFAAGLRALDRVFQLGTELVTPMGYRLIGPPGSGKTVLFQFFRDSLPRSALFSSSLGAIGLRVPKRPASGLFIREFLRQLRYPFAGGSYRQLYERRYLVFEALRANGTRLVWLDEAHHLLSKHASKTLTLEENETLEFFRELMDECRLSLVLAGSSELDNLPAVAPHFCSRVSGREVLDPFQADTNWLGFLTAFSREALGFHVGLIADRKFGMLLHMATGGNLRAFKQLIIEAVLIAHDRAEQGLTQDSFHKAFGCVFGHANLRSNPFA